VRNSRQLKGHSPCSTLVTNDLWSFGMFDPKIFDDLSRKLVDGLPSGLQALQGDVERNVKASLEAALRQMNLVSRDEFEIQQAILMRTREKVEALETRVAELEVQLKSK
jgi:BMFP domain-containing protein YqiC